MKELIEKYVDKRATVLLGGLNVEVVVVDVKIQYGKERYKVTPVAGKGEVWVERVTLAK